MKIKNLASIGGDSRQDFVINKLSQYGLKIDKIDMLDDNISFYDGFVLPLPVSTDNININSSKISIEEFINKISNNQIIFGGKINEHLKLSLSNKKISYYDYYLRDEFALKNAEPTAMGVLAYVMNNSERTLFKQKVLVIGYGRCGRAVCKLFNAVGADVTSASRRYLTIAQAQSDGINAYHLKEINEYVKRADIIVNTVAEKILDKEFIDNISEKAIVIDIASYPYGFNYDYAKERGKKITLLPSIPGKYFPETAGSIIADTIINIAEEWHFE